MRSLFSIWYNGGMIKRFARLLLLAPLLFSYAYTPEEIALRAEQKLRSLKTLKAHFTQTYVSKSITTTLQEKGEFYFKKDGLMKWIYKEPEEKTFLIKDGMYFFFLPEDNQLLTSSLKTFSHESEILDLLSGTVHIQDKYRIEMSRSQKDPARLYSISLVPREEEEYSAISLDISRSSWLIQKATFNDWAGNKTEFLFSGIQTNIQLAADTFDLKLPPDVEIIEYDKP
jgi:outer membrane lipoprotein carrier protein